MKKTCVNLEPILNKILNIKIHFKLINIPSNNTNSKSILYIINYINYTIKIDKNYV